MKASKQLKPASSRGGNLLAQKIQFFKKFTLNLGCPLLSVVDKEREAVYLHGRVCNLRHVSLRTMLTGTQRVVE